MQDRQLEELKQLLETGQVNKIALQEFLSTLNNGSRPARAYKPPPPPVTHYTTVRRHYVCLHCGHQWKVETDLRRGEHINTIQADGTIGLVAYQGNKVCDVKTHTSRCDRCQDAIQTWSRETLEERYMELLSRSPWKEVKVA